MEDSSYTTRELSPKTWPDFLRLFSQGNGWDHCCCMHFHRPCGLPKSEWLPTRAQRAVRNRRQKKALLDQGRAHGILVYTDGQPVAWCQYGPQDELPRIDSSRKYRALAPQLAKWERKGTKRDPQQGAGKFWRITCFAVLKQYRKRGVATAALHAALESIRNKGGGLVEAYPISSWETRAFGNESTHGTASMFANAGFHTVGQLAETRFSSHVLMRRTV